MCFILKNNREEVQIATKDIIVYKRLLVNIDRTTKKKYYTSPYQSFIYEPKECYFESESFRGKITREINKGLHSYINRYQADIESWPYEKIVKCIIPEGAKYYKNNTQYVSDYLIIGK